MLGLFLVAALAVLLIFMLPSQDNDLDEIEQKEDYIITNVHENIESESQARKLLEVMNATNIAVSVLSAAPEELFHYDGQEGFTNEEENNEEVLEIANEYDQRFYAFCTIDPSDTDKLDKVIDCIEEGGDGIKLYNGHSFFYEYPLDDDQMLGIYRFAEEQGIPMIMHVNTAYYLDQFENVLTLYPDMTVICPHFCLSSKNPSVLVDLFDNYPNLYVDISFGYKDYLVDGLTRISENAEVFKTLFEAYSDRFLFGTVTVITEDDEEKTIEWLIDTYQTYRDLLEETTYETFHIEGEQLNGLELSETALQNIYEDNWEKILES